MYQKGFFNLRILTGDVFSANCSLAHCVGADFRMGAGIAVKFRDLFGQVDYLKSQNVEVGGCGVIKVTNPDRYIYYLVTKESSFENDSTYEAMKNSLIAMRDHMLANNVRNVAMPQIGSGLDRMEWDRVVALLHNVFGKYDLDVTIYKYRR
ncbi:ADP-ribose glycohydrolase OARD1-like [Chironomus tepperi]|uniref:ADP-ribose glycohydrolase OARD1-like n=1 Tax=Chironomus tepperi TaxID=113505 RepID=UPI00391F2EBF